MEGAYGLHRWGCSIKVPLGHFYFYLFFTLAIFDVKNIYIPSSPPAQSPGSGLPVPALGHSGELQGRLQPKPPVRIILAPPHPLPKEVDQSRQQDDNLIMAAIRNFCL